MSAMNGVSGAFSSRTGSVPMAGLTQSVSVGAQSVELNPEPVTSAAGNLPSVSFGTVQTIRPETVVVGPTNDTVLSAVITTAT
jgi:hypothetical protein